MNPRVSSSSSVMGIKGALRDRALEETTSPDQDSAGVTKESVLMLPCMMTPSSRSGNYFLVGNPNHLLRQVILYEARTREMGTQLPQVSLITDIFPKRSIIILSFIRTTINVSSQWQSQKLIRNYISNNFMTNLFDNHQKLNP